MSDNQMQKIGRDVTKVFVFLFIVFVGIMGSITLFAMFLARLSLS